MSKSRYYSEERKANTKIVSLFYTKPKRRKDKVALQKAIREDKEYLSYNKLKDPSMDWW